MLQTFKSHLRSFYHRNRRVYQATRAKDCAYIPKVPDAGKIAQYNDTPVQIMHNGVRVFAGGYHGHFMMKIIKKLKGHHEPQEERVFHEILKHVPDDGVMLEIGSYWAYYSLWFSHNKPQRKNYLMEPVAYKRELGEKNFKLNDKTVTIDPYYIKTEDISLSDSTSAPDNDLKDAKPISIDEYLKEKKIDHLDILHADIQGAEGAMLQGAEHSLKDQKIDYLFISTHFDKHQPCLDLLQHHDYKILATHTPQQSASEDGLIVACSPNSPYQDPVEISIKN